MRSQITFMAVLLFCCGSVSFSCKKSGIEGFQKTKWGMSVEEVKKQYPNATEKMVKRKLKLKTTDDVAGYKAKITFGFELEGNKLSNASLEFKPDPKLSSIGDLLREKYGAPTKFLDKYGKHLTSEDKEKLGDFFKEALIWNNGDTEIMHAGFDAFMLVVYAEREYFERANTRMLFKVSGVSAKKKTTDALEDL